jgi:hypothetical protein
MFWRLLGHTFTVYIHKSYIFSPAQAPVGKILFIGELSPEAFSLLRNMFAQLITAAECTIMSHALQLSAAQ